MQATTPAMTALLTAALLSLGACGPVSFGERAAGPDVPEAALRQRETFDERRNRELEDGRNDDELNEFGRRETLFDLFRNADDPNTTVEVNKYIWTAAQQVLDFMPIEAVDPFTGVIVYGYGQPPGGGAAYRATVAVQDPSLDARALNVALQTRSGPATPDTVRAVEDAILTRARQLRLRDSAL